LKPKVPAYLVEVVARKVIAIGHTEEREDRLKFAGPFDRTAIFFRSAILQGD
jgi:hypothetical protein